MLSVSTLSPLDLTWQFSSPGCSEKTGGAVEGEQERRDEEGGSTMADEAFGQVQGQVDRALERNCHAGHICNYPHPLKGGLDRAPTGVYTERQQWLGSPRMPVDPPCQRQHASHGRRENLSGVGPPL
ncbi:hypothetical protein Q5P01_026136 [Channa striata]|uniref:Uncharacterized protein n=1 Tax=Channa striata TaxID=64152 RepID=A0AA88LN99_CHASR|nr:hypothetical protein Q5P01_026136 [Channa striata]